MQALAGSQLLRAWEQGLNASPIQRGLSLLVAALPDLPAEQLAALPIGRRDALLLRIREQTFGPELPCLVCCPHCDEALELSLPVTGLILPETEPPANLSMQTAGWRVEFRLPTSADLLEISTRARGGTPLHELRGLLLERCLLSAAQDGAPAPPPLAEKLPGEALAMVLRAMEETDPQAIIQFPLTCPACETTWDAHFEILSFLWTEVQASARKLLREVHSLALAYGWREADILAMSAERRQCYLEMVGE